MQVTNYDMAKTPNRIHFFPLLDPRDVNQNVIRSWTTTQADSLGKTVQVIESQVNIIQLYNPTLKSPKKDWAIKLDKLIVSYLTKKIKVNKGERDEIKKQTDNLGLLFPVSDITDTEPEELSHAVNILSQITADFKYIDLLDHLADVNNSESVDKLPIPISCLLFTIERYINLILFSDSLIASVKYLEGWLSHYSPFHSKQLSTQQFLSWFYTIVDEVISSNNPVAIEDIEEYHPEVLALIIKYKKIFIEELQEVKESNSKYFFFASFPDFENDLKALLSKDNDLILFGDFLVFRNQLNIPEIGQYNHLFQKALDEESIFDHISKVFTRKNVVNKVKSLLTFKRPIQGFSLFQLRISEYEHLLNKKSNLSESEHATIMLLAQSSLIPKNEKYTSAVTLKIENYHFELSNSISNPYYRWDKVDKKIIPKLNIASREDIDTATAYLKAKLAHEKAEAQLIKKYVQAIVSIQSRTALDNLVNSVPSFFYSSNQKRWNIAIRQAEEALKMRSVFRNQKMRELGIDLDENFTDAQKEVFLTEMLSIEEEIQNYVPFVTAAFKTALPAKRTTEFDTFRHQSDGIEFDPETVFDPEKWIRGNVMKTLKTKIKKGEVSQVNCFCLDLSGSMDHERMRNLYKILYLLVTGLQSRKSFDAFHFFSNNFIPGVEFDYEYTRKNLLFKILTIVSRIEGPHIIYTGLEGTNISAGVLGCQEKMQNFIKILRNKDPNINLSCSMFVITDGEPTMGIRNLKELNKFITKTRSETKFAIKGIYIKSKKDKKKFITQIFEEEHSAETSSFEEGVQKLTNIMSKTYMQQRRDYKWEKKRARLARKLS